MKYAISVDKHYLKNNTKLMRLQYKQLRIKNILPFTKSIKMRMDIVDNKWFKKKETLNWKFLYLSKRATVKTDYSGKLSNT